MLSKYSDKIDNYKLRKIVQAEEAREGHSTEGEKCYNSITQASHNVMKPRC